MDSSHQPRVCISLCEPTLEAFKAALTNCKNCDLVEIRLDCLESSELETAAERVTQLLQHFNLETILTLRPWGRGREPLSDETRLGFWSSAIFSESFFDVELELAEQIIGNETLSLPIDWSRTICSHHDFEEVPAQVDQLYERLSSTPAGVLKIAAQANDVIDCVPLFQLLERAHTEGRQLIAIAMGPAGVATRILGPSRGAFLTYATPEDGSATAPGQLSSRELTDVYRIAQIDRKTDVFGLVGFPALHSVSPQIQNAAFAAAQFNAVYIPFETKDVGAFLKRMVHPRTREINLNIKGLSVTAPHKAVIMEHLDWIEPLASEIGAVNTIVVKEGGLHGYNTDAAGFMAPLMRTYGDLSGANCALLGAGGAASAAVWALRGAGARTTVFARDLAQAKALAERFKTAHDALSAAQLSEFDLVVNATPLGSVGALEHETPVIAPQLRGARLAYDLVYNPDKTRFLCEAQEAGCEVLGGLPMLIAQAVEQFKLWFEVDAPESVMYEAAQRKLDEIAGRT